MLGELQVLLLAMTPLGELRAAIPVGLVLLHMPWPQVYFWALVGNILAVVLLLLFLEPVAVFLRQNWRALHDLVQHWSEQTHRRHGPLVQRFGYLALIILVAIPLPLTGGWTGALLALLFKVPFRTALGLITIGLAIAGGVTMFLVQGGLALAK